MCPPQVQIRHNNELVYVGTYGTAREAARAADWEIWRLKWPRNLLNFPNASMIQAGMSKPVPIVKGRINHRPQPRGKNRLGFKGVFAVKQKSGIRYRAQVWLGGKAFPVKGSFANITEAAKARDRKAVLLGRSAAFLNFPEDFAAHKTAAETYDSSEDEDARPVRKVSAKKAVKGSAKKAIADSHSGLSSDEEEDFECSSSEDKSSHEDANSDDATRADNSAGLGFLV